MSDLNQTNGSDIELRCNDTDDKTTNAKYIAFYAILFTCSLCTLIGNGIIVHIYRTVKKARNSRNFFIFLLALTDLCIVPIVPIMSSLYLVRRIAGDNEYLQVANYSVYIASLGASTLSLLVLSFDRFLAIMSPLKHRRAALGHRPFLVTGSVWMTAGVVGIVIPLGWHQKFDPDSCDWDWDLLHVIKLEYFKFILFPMFFAITVLMVAFYVAIFVKSRKQRFWREEFDQGMQKSKNRETKMVITAILIIGIFYICWLPFIFVTGAQVWNPSLRKTRELSHVRAFLGILPLVNSAINPIIYAYRVPVFKKQASEILSCCINVKRPNKAETNGSISTSSM